MKTVALRMIIAVALIVLLPLFYVYLVFYTDVSMLAMGGIALLILLTLSTATAWTATGVPQPKSECERTDKDD